MSKTRLWHGWLGLDALTARQRKLRSLPGVCEPGRSQSPHSTAAVSQSSPAEDRGKAGQHKPVPGKAGREGGCVTDRSRQHSTVSAVLAQQGAEASTTGGSWSRAAAWAWLERKRASALARVLPALATASKDIFADAGVRSSHRRPICETASMRKTTGWRAVRGKTACTVRKRGVARAIPTFSVPGMALMLEVEVLRGPW